MIFYFPGMAVGMILLQTAIVAPGLFRTLEIEDFGRSIRNLWPKFFISLAMVGFLGTMMLYLDGDTATHRYIITGLTFFLSSICYLIIPATNKATDEGNHRRFDILHRLSVSFTLLILIANIAYYFL